MSNCWHCHAETPYEHALRIAENKFALHYEDWQGWRFSGRFLIAPGKAGRITPQRLLGILWEEQNRMRRAKAAPPAKVHKLPARERFEGYA